jgi:hypothetical protein
MLGTAHIGLTHVCMRLHSANWDPATMRSCSARGNRELSRMVIIALHLLVPQGGPVINAPSRIGLGREAGRLVGQGDLPHRSAGRRNERYSLVSIART